MQRIRANRSAQSQDAYPGGWPAPLMVVVNAEAMRNLEERRAWRWRRAKLGIVMPWTFTACTWTMEDSIARDLRVARYHWLEDQCPRPPDPEKYLPTSRSFTGFVYTVSVTAKDPELEHRTQGLFKERKSPGLFAVKLYSSDMTYVIATTGEIYSLDNKGVAHLFETYE